MIVPTLLSAYYLTVAAAAAGGDGHGQDQLAIATTSGHVHGKIDPELPNVRQFLGIPYAQPPVQDLRWRAPQPLSQPDAQIEATRLPPSCNQFLSTMPSIYTAEVLQYSVQGFNETGAISEDCLTASIWAPATPSQGYGARKGRKGEALPVLIYIYGGAFSGGGQDVPYQIPAQWVNRTPDHIVVSFNYRINIFGFPGAEGLDDQNLGLLDQRAAVEWVEQNIAAFGGDPEQMIIFGQSAGASSVDYYNYAYPEHPIVKGLIMESGTAFIPIGGDRTGTNFTYVATQLGYPGPTTDSTSLLTYMRSLPATAIESFLANYTNAATFPSLSFAPIPDNKTIFANYTTRALANHTTPLPALIGTNAQDGIAFAPYSPTGPNTTLATTAYLSTFFCPATETIRLRHLTARPTYSYLYAGNFSNISPKPWMGAYHSAELPLLFGTHSNFRGQSSELEFQTSRAMQDAWVAFARDPEKGLEGQGWRVYGTLGAEEVREFGDGVAARDVSLKDLEGRCNGAVPVTDSGS